MRGKNGVPRSALLHLFFLSVLFIQFSPLHTLLFPNTVEKAKIEVEALSPSLFFQLPCRRKLQLTLTRHCGAAALALTTSAMLERLRLRQRCGRTAA